MNIINNKIMEIGTYCHDFVMNNDYKQSDLSKAELAFEGIQKIDSDLHERLNSVKQFVITYKGANPENINRSGVLAHFENLAEQLFSEAPENDGTQEGEQFSKGELGPDTVEAYFNLGKVAARLRYEGSNNIEQYQNVIDEYEKHRDSAISLPLRDFLSVETESRDRSKLKDICYEIFYVISSGTRMESFI